MVKGLIPAGCVLHGKTSSRSVNAAWKNFLKLPLNGLGQEIFFHCWLFICAWDQLVASTWTHVCQFTALAWRVEQNNWFIMQVPLSKDVCRGYFWCGSSSQGFPFMQLLQESSPGLGAKQKWCAGHSQELFCPLVSHCKVG